MARIRENIISSLLGKKEKKPRDLASEIPLQTLDNPLFRALLTSQFEEYFLKRVSLMSLDECINVLYQYTNKAPTKARLVFRYILKKLPHNTFTDKEIEKIPIETILSILRPALIKIISHHLPDQEVSKDQQELLFSYCYVSFSNDISNTLKFMKKETTSRIMPREMLNPLSYWYTQEVFRNFEANLQAYCNGNTKSSKTFIESICIFGYLYGYFSATNQHAPYYLAALNKNAPHEFIPPVVRELIKKNGTRQESRNNALISQYWTDFFLPAYLGESQLQQLPIPQGIFSTDQITKARTKIPLDSRAVTGGNAALIAHGSRIAARADSAHPWQEIRDQVVEQERKLQAEIRQKTLQLRRNQYRALDAILENYDPLRQPILNERQRLSDPWKKLHTLSPLLYEAFITSRASEHGKASLNYDHLSEKLQSLFEAQNSRWITQLFGPTWFSLSATEKVSLVAFSLATVGVPSPRKNLFLQIVSKIIQPDIQKHHSKKRHTKLLRMKVCRELELLIRLTNLRKLEKFFTNYLFLLGLPAKNLKR